MLVSILHGNPALTRPPKVSKNQRMNLVNSANQRYHDCWECLIINEFGVVTNQDTEYNSDVPD
ncbi:hypothetical protein M405DRAFT_818259 [Rhizopogon salebrosus TDB-379]|nr:hypothetical protein M405DRAFT_818259 [Rhizopogon salebrosus TDB-379]